VSHGFSGLSESLADIESPDNSGMTFVLEIAHIPELVVPGRRLGRHVLHDERSKQYAVEARSTSTLRSVRHQRHVPIFDQGDLGSCTGNAALGALGTGSLYDSVSSKGINFSEDTAISIYSAATRLDSFSGAYPPADTGSDGLSVAKALKNNGWISGYQHALSLQAALTALQTAPVIVGVDWYEGFDEPDSDGLVTLSGQARGGHEFVLDGVDVDNKRVYATNSWGESWGQQGHFCFSWGDLSDLLSADGDVTVFVPLTQPAPTPTPVPTPTPSLPGEAADSALVAAMDPWEKTIVSRVTKAGKAKAAYDAWKAAKAL